MTPDVDATPPESRDPCGETGSVYFEADSK